MGPNRKLMRDVVRRVLLAEGMENAEISIALLSDARMQFINEKYLHHDGPTDVITFPYSQPGESPLAGEILVSLETAAREAARRGHTAQAEVVLYLVHGLLHLLGYDDHAPPDRRKMRRRERLHLKALGVALKR